MSEQLATRGSGGSKSVNISSPRPRFESHPSPPDGHHHSSTPILFDKMDAPRDPLSLFPPSPDATSPASLLQLLFAASSAFAQNWTVNPFIPPAIPLAVKTPYLQTWIQRAGANSSLNYGRPYYLDGSVDHESKLLQRIRTLTA